MLKVHLAQGMQTRHPRLCWPAGVPNAPAIDHFARRRERVIREVLDAGKRLGLKEDILRANNEQLEVLLPALAPNLDKMKAADWAKVSIWLSRTAWCFLQRKVRICDCYSDVWHNLPHNSGPNSFGCAVRLLVAGVRHHCAPHQPLLLYTARACRCTACTTLQTLSKTLALTLCHGVGRAHA